MHIERKQMTANHERLMLSNVTIKPIGEGKPYKYLSIDENISFDRLTTKENIIK